ncbi:MAG: serine/threonine-protein kinase, partial [Acidobacteriota bacterium]
MSPAHRARLVVQLLDEALELGEGTRQQFLDRACGNDKELRQELEALLAEETAGDGSFLEVPAAVAAGKVSPSAPTQTLPSGSGPSGSGPSGSGASGSQPGSPSQPEQLGPYRIVERLGRGGMGTVYLGEQEQPIRRRVALKVIDSIHDDLRARRFAAECQALAHLSHPNVASLYEVGASDDGQTFVAMELVEGNTITAWCDRHELRLRQRMELFLGVCAGVRHAHEKGILHRDLKPSNVLVTEVDGRPTAKVIDFGIARALDEPLLADTPQLTREHQIIGSPAFMSPEMVFGSRDVDTRSDVYALGIVLYEMLAGALPFDPKKQSLASLLGSVTRGSPPIPSLRFADLELEQRQAIAKGRQLSEDKLRRRLVGDLDAIVSKAIAFDREKRYSSPADLAADLERHLQIQPVVARPAAFSYVLGRYLRRRAGFVGALTALILAMAAGVIVSTHEARRANREAERALLAAERSGRDARRARLAQAEGQEVLQFVVDLFEVADPERNPNAPVDVRQLLDRGAERLRHELADQPLARARLLHTISDIYTKLARFEQAEDVANEGLALREAEL